MKEVHELLVVPPPKHVSPSTSSKIHVISASNKMKERLRRLDRKTAVLMWRKTQHHGFFSMTEAHEPLCSFKNSGF